MALLNDFLVGSWEVDQTPREPHRTASGTHSSPGGTLCRGLVMGYRSRVSAWCSRLSFCRDQLQERERFLKAPPWGATARRPNTTYKTSLWLIRRFRGEGGDGLTNAQPIHVELTLHIAHPMESSQTPGRQASSRCGSKPHPRDNFPLFTQILLNSKLDANQRSANTATNLPPP